MKRKLFCIWMCIALIVTLIPSMAFAEELSEALAVQTGNEDEQQGEAEAVLAKYDEDADNYYFSATETVYASAGGDGSYYYLGTKSGDHFTEANSEQLESCTMTVKKNGVVQGKTVVSAADGITQNDAITGIDYGISYEQDEETNEVLQIYPELSFHLSSEATKDYQAVCGTYTIEAAWTENGENYTAATEMTVIPGKVLSEICWMTKDENGVIDSMYANDTEASQGLTVQYSPFKSYMETQWNEETDAEEQVEVTESYIYTDSDVSGIFDFIGVEGSSDDVASAAAGVFATGEKLLFDSQTQVVPLVVHRKNISSDMIGKTFSLQFRKGGQIATVTAKIENEDANISLEENKLYAFHASGGVVSEIDAAGNIRLNSNADLQQDVQTHIEISADEGGSYVFAVYQEGKLQAVKLKIENENKPMQVEAVGDYEYVLEGLQPGECVLHAADDASLSILCRVGLPERGIYASRERSENAYLDSEFHFINAKQKKSDNSEAYFYVMMPKYNSDIIKTQNDLTISFARYNNDKDDWVLRNEDGIYFTQDGIYTDADNGKDYYVWKVTVQEKYADDQRGKYIRVYGGLSQDEESGETYYGYSRNIWLHIYDSQEIDKEHQLYWVYDSSEIEISTDGKIALSSETEEVLDGRANIQIYRENKSGSMEGYFAVKKAGEYYALRTVQTSKTEGISLSASADTPYLYKVEWSKFGEYLITATDDNGTEYRMNFNVKLPEIGFYSTATRNDGTYIGNEFHYIDAAGRNADNTEAYFYLIAPTYNYSLNQISVSFGEWLSEDEAESDGWTEKKISGMEIGTPQMATFGNEEYAVWKITVSNAYRNPYNKYQEFFIVYSNGRKTRDTSLRVYDSTEIAGNQQLYWIDSDYANIDEEYKISIIGDWFQPKKNLFANRKSKQYCGYFAFKTTDERYQAINTVESDSDIFTVTASDDKPYQYILSWENFGETRLHAVYNQETYFFDVKATMPEIAFFTDESLKEEFFIDEDIWFSELQKKDDESEAYCYAAVLKSDFDEKYELKTEAVEGLKIETVDAQNNDYRIWKIIFDAEKFIGGYIKFGIGNLYMYKEIHDVTDPKTGGRLCYFLVDTVNIDVNGKISRKNDMPLAIFEYKNMEFMPGQTENVYFAVNTEEDEYYLVDNLVYPESEACRINKNAENNSYTVKALQTGKCKIKAGYKGKSYGIFYECKFERLGLYSQMKDKETLADSCYLKNKEFHLRTEREMGKEDSFYVLLPKHLSASKPTLRLQAIDGNEKNMDMQGLSVKSINDFHDEKSNLNYYVWEISVTDEFNGESGSGSTRYGICAPTDSGTIYQEGCTIYDAKEIYENEQMYFLRADFAHIGENNQLEENGKNLHLWIWMGNSISSMVIGKDVTPIFFSIIAGDYNFETDNYPLVVPDYIEEETGNVILKKNEKGAYILCANKTGEYRIKGVYQGKSYYMDIRCGLPELGLYRKPFLSEEDYLFNEFAFDKLAREDEESVTIFAVVQKEANEVLYEVCLEDRQGRGIPKEDISIGEISEHISQLNASMDENFSIPIVIHNKNFKYEDCTLKVTFKNGDRNVVYETENLNFYGKGEKPQGSTISGIINGMRSKDEKIRYYLYPASTSDMDIINDLKNMEQEKALRYEVIQENCIQQEDGTYQQAFSFTDVMNGYYKLVIQGADGSSYIKKLLVASENIDCGNVRLCSLGDVDENGKIDFADALYFKRYLANWPKYEEINLRAGDTNGDGELTPADLMILERHIASWKGYEKLPKVS